MPAVDPQLLARLLPDTDALAEMLNQLPLGVAVMAPDGRMVLANRQYTALTGADPARIIGLRCLHVLRCDFCTQGCPLYAGWPEAVSRQTDADIINRKREKALIRLTVAPLVDDMGAIRACVETIAPRHKQAYAETAGSAFGLGELIGKSQRIKKIFAMAPAIAQTDSPVLITGETGTGKDALAEEIHRLSGRHEGPFVTVNCSALPETLLESELFGHAKNAFPGAGQAKRGRLSTAHNGTLLMTDIGELPLPLQSKLLTYLDNHTVYPMGSSRGVHTDVRIIVTSHRPLEALTRKKRFRRDLHYRLNVIQLHLPALRERGEDISLLQDHFLRMFQARYGKSLDGFSPNAEKLLLSYTYPGNIREMRNVIEYSVNFCDGKRIRLRHLPGYMLHTHPPAETPEPQGETSPQPVTKPQPSHRPQSWEDVQRTMILDALVKTGGKKQQAAKLLGWGRSTLWRKMKQFGMD